MKNEAFKANELRLVVVVWRRNMKNYTSNKFDNFLIKNFVALYFPRINAISRAFILRYTLSFIFHFPIISIQFNRNVRQQCFYFSLFVCVKAFLSHVMPCHAKALPQELFSLNLTIKCKLMIYKKIDRKRGRILLKAKRSVSKYVVRVHLYSNSFGDMRLCEYIRI